MLVYGLCVVDIGLNEYQKSIILKNVEADIKIRGFVAHLTTKLRYSNVSDRPLEVAYRAPVDESAAFYNFEALVDGRKIKAECLEKKKAKEIYKDAISQGKTATYMQQDELCNDLLHVVLGNFPPGTTADLTLSMVLRLKVGACGVVQFVLPTVFTPRYSPAGTDQRHMFVQLGHPSDYHLSTNENYKIQINCEVLSNHKILEIKSATDQIQHQLLDGGLKALVMNNEYKADHDWSIDIYYHDPYTPHGILETGESTSSGFMKDDMLMVNFFPEIPLDSISYRNEIIFVIDQSGSMHGASIARAKSTLELFLKSLPAGCHFNVVGFGSSYRVLFESSLEYTKNNLQRAINHAKTLEANLGGTEILQPLKHIYAQPSIEGFNRQILVITDGAVSNVSSVLDLIRRHSNNTRLFSVGIGHGASTALVKGAAEAGRGRWEMVLEEELLEAKVMGLMMNMVQDSFQDLTIKIERTPSSRVTIVPKIPPVIFGGQHLVLYARVEPKTVVNSIEINGTVSGKPVSFTVKEESIKRIHDTEYTMHRLAAKEQIKEWQMDDEDEENIVSLSTKTGVVSRYTAFVGVDEDGKSFKEKPIETFYAARQQELMMSSPAMFRSAPQSSSPMFKKKKGGHSGNVSGSFFGAAPGIAGSQQSSLLQMNRLGLSSSASDMFRSAPKSAMGTSMVQMNDKVPEVYSGTEESEGPQQYVSMMSSFGSSQPVSDAQRSAPPPPPPSCFGGFTNMTSISSMSNAQPESQALRKTRLDVSDSLLCDDENEECMDISDEKCKEKSTAATTDTLMGFLECQEFDGSWDADKIIGFLSKKTSKAIIFPNNHTREVWSAGLAICILEKFYEKEKLQWTIIGMKTRLYLQNQNTNVEHLLEEIKQWLEDILKCFFF